MRKTKIFFLAAFAIGAVSMFSCSKSSSSTSTKDSVYYSPWQTISMEPTDAGDTAYAGTISASRITASILSTGAVLTYLGDPGYPGTGDTAVESAVDFGLYATMVPGSIQIQSFGYLNDFSGALFRYVVIPGTVLETTGLTPQKLKSMNFTEVTNVLNSASAKTSSPSLATP